MSNPMYNPCTQCNMVFEHADELTQHLDLDHNFYDEPKTYKKLQVLYHDAVTTVSEHRDGSVTIVQSLNEIKDTQQIIVLSAQEWQAVLMMRKLTINKEVK